MLIARIAVGVAGVAIIVLAVSSAIRTFVVPRGEFSLLTRATFLAVRVPFDWRARRRRTVEQRERTLGRYGPVATLCLVAVWVLLLIVAFALVDWVLGDESFTSSLALSGSSFTTLGFRGTSSPTETAVAVAEGLIGLGMIAILITYLPTLYQLFSRREAQVVLLDVRAGSPPTAVEMLSRFHRIGWLDRLDEAWESWERWFAELEESHLSYPNLVHFRSQRPQSSWITAAGAVLDTAAIEVSALDLEVTPQAPVTIRAGSLALRAVADFFAVPLDHDPAPNDPISVHREEFLLLLDELAGIGLPVKADREQAWRDFAGWRVNYDTALLALCALHDAPPTPWSSDRAGRFHPPTLRHPTFRVDPPDTPPSW